MNSGLQQGRGQRPAGPPRRPDPNREPPRAPAPRQRDAGETVASVVRGCLAVMVGLGLAGVTTLVVLYLLIAMS